MRGWLLTKAAIRSTKGGSSMPQRPHSAIAYGLSRMGRVQCVVRLPGGLEALVVEVVGDHVDVLVSGVVRVCRVGGNVRRPVALRVPDHARLSALQVAAQRRPAELAELGVQLPHRSPARDERDARERPPESCSRVARAARRAVPVEGAVFVPVAVHLRHRSDVHALTEPGECAVEGEQERVASPLRDVERGHDAARLDRDHRQRCELAEQLRDRVGLMPADERLLDRGALSRQLLEAAGLPEDAEQDARLWLSRGACCGRGRDEREREPEQCDEPHDTTHSSRCGVDSHSTPSAVTTRSSSSPMYPRPATAVPYSTVKTFPSSTRPSGAAP